MKNLSLLSFILFLSVGCDTFSPDSPKDYNGKFLEEVVALDDFNSEFDDYNSNLPSNREGLTQLTFSSKRDKKDYFNLVYIKAEFTYGTRLALQKYSGERYYGSDYFGYYNSSDFLASRANGNFNVLGPKTVSFPKDFKYNSMASKDFILFYADDSEKDLEIKYIADSGERLPVKFSILNSSKDDAYPSFSSTGDKIYFCSNRGGDFDIYEVSIPRTENEVVTVESLINPKVFTLRKVDELSSPYEDKCPYLYENTMVFVSNRPGGKGGFDIYSSKFENGKWSAPINAGDRINTTFNEYRPILPSLDHFTYNLMLFSSDRPGGKGGFDLYMTGLDQRWK